MFVLSLNAYPQRPDASIRQAGIYQAALKYAYQKNGCMKLFSAREDRGAIKAGDVFIYAGSNSAQTGKTLQDMVDRGLPRYQGHQTNRKSE